MTLNPNQCQHLESLAKQLIDGLRVVELAAQREYGRNDLSPSNVLIAPYNPMVGDDRAAFNLTARRQALRNDLARLLSEPFVAYVQAEDETGITHHFYIARANPLKQKARDLNGMLVTYGAPLGRLAELRPTATIELTLNNHRASYTIVERVRFRPSNTNDGWDGLNDEIELGSLVVTLESLRKFLAQLDEGRAEPQDLLAEILLSARAASIMREGKRRRVIDRMSLRDQPIVDTYQGEVFRLPLNKRLMLAGAPGTGKTTTLIRRLAQKRRAEEIGDDEQEIVPPEFFHPDNWIMFTPTDLLKLYLKEAFAKEGIAASDERVRTWADERRRLSRDVFKILRSERGGRFILDDFADILSDLSSTALMGLADAFFAFFRNDVANRYDEILMELMTVDDPTMAGVLGLMRSRIGGTQPLFDQLFELPQFHEELAQHIRRIESGATESRNGIINRMLLKDRGLLDRLSEFLDAITSDSEDDEEDDEADDEPLTTLEDRRLFAARTLARSISTRAISLYAGRSVQLTGRNGRVWEWLKPNSPSDDVLQPLGGTLLMLRQLRYLAGTYTNLVDRIPSVYNRFRRAALKNGDWYRSDAKSAIEQSRVVGHEVDVILLFMLQQARRLLSTGTRRHQLAQTTNGALEGLKGEYVTQVLVDEATDFSPVQLSCMLELAHPSFRSYFACGDVRQRFTRWGVRHMDELQWVSPDFEVRHVELAYRQSRPLVDFALALANLDGEEPPLLRPQEYVADADVQPALGENLSGGDLTRWLSERIREIARALRMVPSVAILVDGDDRVDSLVEALRPVLAEQNLDVIGCKGGRVAGVETQIRVFDVQHIKGLEFESVFFVGVDTLMARLNDLFGKYLYVGITRAATYLGITCEVTLPPALEPLRSHFTTGWN